MNRTLFFFALLVGVCARCTMLIYPQFVNGGEVDVYLADEGIVGLMAKHIVEGRDWPIFFYGQDYLGALEAYCVATVFALFGVGALGLHLVPFLFSIGILVSLYRFVARRYSIAAARWATALVAVAPAYFMQWTLKARGGFVEHVLLLLVALSLFCRVYLDHDRRWITAVVYGFVCGVALWVNQLAFGYLAVMAGLLLLDRSDRRSLGVMAGGFVVGSSLLLAYNVTHPLATARALVRKAVVLNRVPEEKRDDQWMLRGVGKRFEALKDGADKLGLVFGVPAGSSVERLGLTVEEREGSTFTSARRLGFLIPLSFFGIALAGAVGRYAKATWIPMELGQIIGVFLLVTVVVGYVSPRYMLPVYPLTALLAGVLLSGLSGARKGVMAASCALVVAYNLVGWADAATLALASPRNEGRELVELLRARGWTRCYSAGPLYHLIFASGEEVLLSPLQKNRYPAYDRDVEASPTICYVHRVDQQEKRQHREMMALLHGDGVTYRTTTIGPYRISHDVSPRAVLSPESIRAIRRENADSAHP